MFAWMRTRLARLQGKRRAALGGRLDAAVAPSEVLPRVAPQQLDHVAHAMRLAGVLSQVTGQQVSNIVHALHVAGALSQLTGQQVNHIVHALHEAGALARLNGEQVDSVVHDLCVSGALSRATGQQADSVVYALRQAGHLAHLKDMRFAEQDAAAVCPTFFHVTHWKAGSQWLHKILTGCTPNRIVPPHEQMRQFLQEPVELGKVYPTLYLTREEFGRVPLPQAWHRFVIIRDLRDTLVSAYFSAKHNHVNADEIQDIRARLNNCSFDDGMLFLLEGWLAYCARIQESWLQAGETLIRYEDLLEHDLEILESVLLKNGYPVSRERFRAVVAANRFANLTGRQRGEEDLTAHERMGMAGDWRRHFSERVKKAFKARYGPLLIATGYEKDMDW